jgi:hypothetical protein
MRTTKYEMAKDALVGDLNPVVATTHRVRDTIFTIESLQNSAASVNERDHKPPLIAEHDQLCPPFGQAISARVVPLADGFHALVAEYDMFPPPAATELPNGEIGFLQQSEKHSYPFASAELHHPTSFCVSVDPTGLGGVECTEEFFESLRNESEIDFETQPHERRSQLPDPQVIFTLGIKASAIWLGVRMAVAASRAIEPELEAFFRVLIRAVKEMAANAIPKTRPVTYVLQVHGNPNLEFVARTRDSHLVISAIADRDCSAVREKVNQLQKHLDAEFIQFLLDNDGNWRFNYLLTKDGKVFGTKESFDRRAVVIEEMHREKVKKRRSPRKRR